MQRSIGDLIALNGIKETTETERVASSSFERRRIVARFRATNNGCWGCGLVSAEAPNKHKKSTKCKRSKAPKQSCMKQNTYSAVPV